MIEPKVIAEIGCNHMGDIELAKKMILEAKSCGAYAVKFQKRDNKSLLSDDQYNSPHPNPTNSYGSTYGAHREFLEFNIDQHMELKFFCDNNDIVYSTSVWDLNSAKEIVKLSPKFIKIPSATNLNFELLEYLCNEYNGKIQLSFGMTKRDEEKAIIDFFLKHKRNKDLLVYSCTSGYPVAFEDICLLEITRLKNDYSDIVEGIGFSGHHLGIAADMAALTLGAEWIERHFTLDRTWKGTDHSASLEPAGFKKLCRDVVNVSKALQYKTKEILDIEAPQRKKLKWGKQ